MCKIIKIIIISLLLVGLFLISLIRYNNINEKYPSRIDREYFVNNIMEYNGFSFKVVKAEMLKYWDFKEKYNYQDTIGIEPYVDENETHILLITIEVSNLSKEEKEMPFIGYFTIQNNTGYSTNFDYYLYLSLFEDGQINFDKELQRGETRTITLPFSIDAHYLKEYNGTILSVSDFDLVISLYPEKNYIKLS